MASAGAGPDGRGARVRCHYEVLGVSRQAPLDDIKKAYRRLALKHHPDKNLDDPEGATRQFKLVQDAWEVLSDPQERAWYDGHREQILYGDSDDDDDDADGDENATKKDRAVSRLHVYQFFSSSCFEGFGESPQGFFAVYGALFDSLDALERRDDDPTHPVPLAPHFGGPDTPYDPDVREFYSFWKNFVSRRNYAFADKWRLSEAPERRVRRLMEKDNKKEQVKARRRHHDLVRELVAYVRKRDPRVRVYEQAAAEEREREERERAVRAREAAALLQREREAHKEVEAERLEQQRREMVERYGAEAVEPAAPEDAPPPEEYVCVVCDKVFKSEQQWQNHEASKKHKKAVAAAAAEIEKQGSSRDKKKKTMRGDEEEDDEEEEKEEDVELFYCDECDLLFPTKKKLKNHRKHVAHEWDDEEEEEAEAVVEEKEDEVNEEEDEDEEALAAQEEEQPAPKQQQQQPQPQKKKKQKRKGKQQKKKDVHRCNVCRAEFPSRSKLFLHLDAENHHKKV